MLLTAIYSRQENRWVGGCGGGGLVVGVGVWDVSPSVAITRAGWWACMGYRDKSKPEVVSGWY